MNPFDVVTAVRSTKKYILGDTMREEDYPKFMVNRALSYHKDAIGSAQDMNLYHTIDNKLQFDYMYRSIRKNHTRSGKWGKAEKPDTKITSIMQYYNYSYQKAVEVSKILNKEQIAYIKLKTSHGE